MNKHEQNKINIYFLFCCVSRFLFCDCVTEKLLQIKLRLFSSEINGINDALFSYASELTTQRKLANSEYSNFEERTLAQMKKTLENDKIAIFSRGCNVKWLWKHWNWNANVSQLSPNWDKTQVAASFVLHFQTFHVSTTSRCKTDAIFIWLHNASCKLNSDNNNLIIFALNYSRKCMNQHLRWFIYLFLNFREKS